MIPLAGIENSFAVISVAGSQTDDELVALTAGAQIVVTGIHLVATGATTVLLESDGSTALTGTMSLAANGIVSMTDPDGMFATVAGESLEVTTGSGAIEGFLTYKLYQP